MNPVIGDLVSRARQLSADDMEVLLALLQQTLDPSAALAAEAAWEAEILRRVEAMDRGQTRFHPWEEVRKDLGLA
jgi:putative addiction module component (TIGR02574 family)